MAQSDLILLILIGLSILIGLIRGFCAEILGLVVYVFSGILGYMFAPIFMPAFTFVSFEPIQRGAAILLGTFIAWIVLKIVTASLVSAVKNSSLNKLDRSLGGIFGGLRAGVLLVVVAVVSGFVSPKLIQSSKILTLSYVSSAKMFKKFPEFDFIEKKEQNKENSDAEPQETETTQEQSWKKRLLYYLQNTTVDTKDGEKKLISSISSVLAKSAPKEMVQNIVASEENGLVSVETYEKILEYVCEQQIVAWLNEEPINEEEMKKQIEKEVQKALLEKIKR